MAELGRWQSIGRLARSLNVIAVYIYSYWSQSTNLLTSTNFKAGYHGRCLTGAVWWQCKGYEGASGYIHVCVSAHMRVFV
jgi:hypothetical protein